MLLWSNIINRMLLFIVVKIQNTDSMTIQCDDPEFPMPDSPVGYYRSVRWKTLNIKQTLCLTGQADLCMLRSYQRQTALFRANTFLQRDIKCYDKKWTCMYDMYNNWQKCMIYVFIINRFWQIILPGKAFGHDILHGAHVACTYYRYAVGK